MKSKLAIASFILGLVSLLSILMANVHLGSIVTYLMVLSAPVGLILGITSIFIIRRYKLGGIWFAILGILLSLIWVLAVVLIGLGMSGAMEFI
jgi:hypothetical protein